MGDETGIERFDGCADSAEAWSKLSALCLLGGRYKTALHEAGHVVVAIAKGVLVESASIRPIGASAGRVTTKQPRPREVDCTPESLWMDAIVKSRLAGDRAVRMVAPMVETATGAPCSDYATARRLLEHVCTNAAHVETELERHCFEVDAFLRGPQTRAQLVAVVDLLLRDEEVSGDTIRDRVVGGTCGALHPDGRTRCAETPHKWCTHYHSTRQLPSDTRPPEPAIIWDGFGPPDETPKSRRTARHRNVVKVFEPHLYPPTNRDMPLDQIPRPSRRNDFSKREMLRMVRVLEGGGRANRSTLLPSPNDSPPADALTQHSDQCPFELGTPINGVFWCEHCAFEFPTKTRQRPGWVYVVVAEPDTRLPDADSPWMHFRTAADASRYLKLLREADEHQEVRALRAPLI